MMQFIFTLILLFFVLPLLFVGGFVAGNYWQIFHSKTEGLFTNSVSQFGFCTVLVRGTKKKELTITIKK